jgi:hypothetical protein
MLALGASAITGAAPAPAAPPKPPPLPLTFVADLPLPGNPSRFDYQWIDTANRRLFIAHLGDSSLLVFDLDGQRVIHEVTRLPSVQSVVAAPALHLVFATATAEKTLALIDDQTFQVKSRVPAGEYPNGPNHAGQGGRFVMSLSAMRKASAEIVSDGLTPSALGITDASATYRPS